MVALRACIGRWRVSACSRIARREPADHQRDRQQQDDGDDVGGTVDTEGSHRLREEEIVGECRSERG